MNNNRITSHETCANHELSFSQLETICGGAVPTEDFTLNYEEIKVTYHREKSHAQWIDLISFSSET